MCRRALQHFRGAGTSRSRKVFWMMTNVAKSAPNRDRFLRHGEIAICAGFDAKARAVQWADEDLKILEPGLPERRRRFAHHSGARIRKISANHCVTASTARPTCFGWS